MNPPAPASPPTARPAEPVLPPLPWHARLNVLNVTLLGLHLIFFLDPGNK